MDMQNSSVVKYQVHGLHTAYRMQNSQLYLISEHQGGWVNLSLGKFCNFLFCCRLCGDLG